ncbi:MAG: GNAT family N-acetyltransferase, partial [Firmicutes bacterium]|nr:GNAT family N-acetyltransferase [Bacillota bacterium]
MKRLEIRKIGPEKIMTIANRNTTVRMDEYLMSLPKEVMAKIMQEPAAVMELMGRLQATLDAEYLCVYGGFLSGTLIAYVSLTKDPKAPEIQIEVLPEYHGQGFGCEMLEFVIRSAFEEFGV